MVILRETLEGKESDYYKRRRKNNIDFSLNTRFFLTDNNNKKMVSKNICRTCHLSSCSLPPPEKKFFAWFCSFLLCLCFKSSLSLPDVALYGILALVNLPVVEGDIFRTLHVSVNGQRLINKNVLVAIDWENVRTIFGIKQKECAEEDCHKAVQRCAPDGKSGWRVFFSTSYPSY